MALSTLRPQGTPKYPGELSGGMRKRVGLDEKIPVARERYKVTSVISTHHTAEGEA